MILLSKTHVRPYKVISMSFPLRFLQLLKNLPLIDLGTGHQRHHTKSKKIIFRHAKKFAPTGKTALDMGCGDGFWSEKLIGLGYRVTSVDHAIHYPKAQAIDLEGDLPFPDESFDLAWSTDVIEHLYRPERIIQEIKRVLKPGGLLLLTTNNSYFWIYPIFRIFGYTPRNMQNPDHKQFFHLRDIERLFPRAKIYGFFPYAILKLTVASPWMINHLSPSFVIKITREDI